MVEELMLLANELVAQWLSKRRCPAIYRVHGKPDEEKLDRLAEVAQVLGVQVEVDDLTEPRGVSRWLKRIQDHPRRTVLEMLLLRSLKQAVYDIVNIGHFGLASDAYLHFTSPIRRYPDLIVHRQVKHLLRGGKPDTRTAAVEDLRNAGTAASVRERAAMEVEREVVDLYRALFMRDRIGDMLEGTVSAIVGSGIYVTLDEPFVDVLVRYDAMGPDYYEPTEDELSVVGLRSRDVVELGDRIVVEIVDVAVLRRSVYARRVPPEKVLSAFERETQKGARGRRRGERGAGSGGRGRGAAGRDSASAGGRNAGGRKAKGRGRGDSRGQSGRGRGKRRR